MRRFFLFFFWIDNDSSYMEVKVNVYRRGIHVSGGIERIASFCGCMATGVDNLDRYKLKKKRFSGLAPMLLVRSKMILTLPN